MKRILLSLVVCLGVFTLMYAQLWPSTIRTGPFKTGHIQGFCVDKQHQYVYYSFTTMLVKTDLKGNIIGTVKGLLGHLGCLAFNEADGRVYGSLEYKDDVIGKGILKMENSSLQFDNAFYVAIFDGDRITRMDMDAEKDGIMTTVFLQTVLDDYLAKVNIGGKAYDHRLACSGIDGISFGPRFGKVDGKDYLTVAYGVYGDIDRTDNDYQVLLQYDISKWKKYESPLSQNKMHNNGPKRPNGQYFVFTGNTNWGVQNLEYDKELKGWWLAVYTGKKPMYPNYPLFMADALSKPTKDILKGVSYIKKGKVVPLKQMGKKDEKTAIYGWNFPLGSTGVCALGDGYYYFSDNFHNKEGQGSVLRLYKYVGNEDFPFEEIK